ncbi:MAG: Flp pilus assembly protein CpaB [Sphingopyxis sp.]|uniref:Flp pilus assembly protein CpaB n=1 Tax=Sphingopyxis sp. TaxID=1908224 RepID=UPI001A5AEE4D|nr:Flp pilus assembly protein CpaB [Sphingopyxis sp.]MBL9071198.1 Flp pilus assembly protein CpaB [Sphingopyxis sp.]
MDTRKIMLIVGALVIAIGAAFGVNQMMRGASAPQARAAAAPDINGPMILVATRQLPAGTIIGPDSFRFQPWPKELVEKAYFMKEKTDVQTLVGTVVRYPITAGQPLTQGALVHPDDRGFLAAALGPGMRAVTVKVSQEQGVAGFVFPGDRVDVVLAQTIEIDTEKSSYPDKQLFTAETIVRNVRVLATDQRYDAEDETGKTPVRTFGSVTLEATPEIAERIAVAQNMGKLSLSLRPLAESSGELEAAIASGDVNVPTKGGTAAERRMLAEAAARPTTAKTATTGGDISRFWIPVSGRVSAARPPQQQGGGAPVAMGAPAAPRGPVVRVTRGDKVTEIPVGGK